MQFSNCITSVKRRGREENKWLRTDALEVKQLIFPTLTLGKYQSRIDKPSSDIKISLQ